MNNLNTIFSKKLKRKNFILISAASALAVYTLIKAPIKLFFSSNKEQPEAGKENSLKVFLNPKAISRNTKV